METFLDLTKGLHTDFEPLDQPVGSYRYLKDAIRQLSGAIENEKGTVVAIPLVGEDTRVVGSYVLDSDNIIFSYCPSTNLSEIGILESNGDYNIITNDESLGFNLDTIIRAEGKRNFKGERIIYFVGKGLPIRILNLDRVPTTDFNDSTKLILTADMPQINLTSVIEGGSLLTGIYQFGVRLLTKSTNATSISLLTNPIPIINEDSTDRDNADGAPPQTTSNKSINLNITNLDPSYEYIEIISVTYIGIANVTQARVITRIPIQGRTTISYTYSDNTQFTTDLDLNGLVVDAVNYNSAEFIAQKDGILVLGALTTNTDTYNYQIAANKIGVKYVIREEVWNENISINNGVDTGTVFPIGNDYKNPNIVVEFKSYMRGEVYSFAISPIFSNWSIGAAYHIPGKINNNSASTLIPADTVTKDLGTYWSTEEYPIDRGYPDPTNFALGRRVRHHVMPTLIQEPHIRYANGNTIIRMLGIRLDLSLFLAEIPGNIKKDIIGYVITKQAREGNNKSILSQGIAAGHELNAYRTGGNTINGYSPISFSGHFPTHSTPPSNGVGGIPFNPVAKKDIVAFYSPESIITKDNLTNATRLKAVLQITGDSYLVSDKRTNGNKYANVLLNYKASTTSTSQLNTTRVIDTASTQYISAGAEQTGAQGNIVPSTISISGLNNSVVTWRNPGYLYLKLDGDLPADDSTIGDGKGEVYYKYEGNATDGIYLNNAQNSTGTTQRHLYNLSRDVTNQYGAVFEAKYYYVKHVLTKDIVGTTLDCYNGDVFITKFSVMNSMSPGVGDTGEVVLKGLNYFWLESTINCGFRHYIKAVGNEGDENYVQGTLPYYPKVKLLSTTDPNNLGIFNYSTSLGHPTGYNKQYSFENTIRSYFPIALELEVVNNYPNRLIYSEQSVEGEQFDAFRTFLANNYHDIPKEKGKITNLFILANKLYVHTERSLWRTYFNEQVTQASSAGEVYLGNGGVFYRPSTEIMTVKGGYAGTKSASSSCTTPFGHFFQDQLQKKVFLFSEELKEISDQGMFKYFRDNITDIADTPARLIGYSSIYDYQNKRWLLTKIGQWTLSYSTQLNSWSAFHSYKPYHYISNGDRIFSTNLNTINEMFIGVYGAYYGELPTDMRLDISINDAPRDTKTIDNVIFHTSSQKNGIEQHYDTWNTLQVYNTTRNTGKCRLIVPRSFDDEFIQLGLFEVFAKLKSNEFRVSVPSDLVIDVEQSIFDESNLDDNRAFRPRISGKYFIASLSYNNLRNNRFILHNLGRLFRQRIR